MVVMLAVVTSLCRNDRSSQNKESDESDNDATNLHVRPLFHPFDLIQLSSAAPA